MGAARRPSRWLRASFRRREFDFLHFRTDTYLHENALRAQANQLFGLAKVAAADAKRLSEKRKGETIASGVAPAAKKGGSSASASSSAAAAN